MEKNFVFTDWHDTHRCIVINGLDVYVLGTWHEDRWTNCMQVDETGRLIRLVSIKPSKIGDKIEGVNIYE